MKRDFTTILLAFFKEQPDLLEYYVEKQNKIRQHVQTEIAAIFQPFYISQFEVTNVEYRQFANSIKDSIALEMVYYGADNDDLSLELLDASKLIYKQDSVTFIAVYPDTTNFDKISSLKYSPLSHMYNWHPAYDNYPVINVNMEQVLAFCHWKEVQVNEKHGTDSSYIHVSPPTIR